MRRFLLGIGMLGVLATLLSVVLSRGDGMSTTRLALLLVTLPVVVSWVVTELIHAVRPRRLFCGRRRASSRLLLHGMATGLTALLLAALGLAFLDQWVADTVIVTIAFAIIVTPAVLMLSRRRPAHCLYCNYDLRGATVLAAGRCVECGEGRDLRT